MNRKEEPDIPESFEVIPQEVQLRRDRREPLSLIDVREPEEFALARIPGFELIPMRSVPAQLQKLQDLSADSPLMVICHHGIRSLQVVYWLREHGVKNCFSVAGGTDRWSREIDPSVPRY